jgi:serine/threonine protein kinase
MSPTPRKSVGTFEIEGELGQGGMGVVYLARQPALERLVVIKGLRRDLAQDKHCEERFRREAQAAAAVHHQNVVAVYDCFTWRGERFIAQEYVDGLDLASVLGKVERLPARLVGLIALELARGLEEIHARGIVHRDLKPANVLVSRDGAAKIADFGIALQPTASALTQTGYSVGTPPYMSPEQLLGARVDFRSDLFAFGLVVYEMLCGVRPFAETHPEGEALVRRIEAGRYTSLRRAAPGTPGWLTRLVKRCLRPKPKRRFASTTALRRALERRLGSPSPADCRREIATGLSERGVFKQRRGETRRAAPAPAAPARRRVRRLAAAAGLVLAAALGLALARGARPGLGLDTLAARTALTRTRPVPGPAHAEVRPPDTSESPSGG